MSGFIGEDQVRKIKSAVDLVQVMGEYAPMRKAGRMWACCCPFHQERSPSCYVYPDQQTYHCFGCGAHGDVITLVRNRENLEFSEAIELIARRAGITIEYQEGKGGGLPRGERDALLAINDFATTFYEQVLWTDPGAAEAREYLQSRRLSRTVCERFRLGWAPGRNALIEAARRKGFDPALLAKVDLAVDRNGRPADRFYERVTFPICDRFGHPIAFSCRLLPAAERAAKEAGRGVGKYVNSTDTPLYHKSNAVFNLHQARTACRDAKRLIVMEGPTDVMAADQAGVRECVAVLGTAMTPEHARQLGSLIGDTGPLVILLDGDAAGVANSRKAVRTCLSVNVPVQVAVLPDQLDPAELLAENQTEGGDGRATFEHTIAHGRADIDHLLRAVAARPYGLDANAQLAAVDEVIEALRPMPDAELRSLHLRACAEWFNLDAAKLERRLAGATGPAPAAPAPSEPGLPALDAPRQGLLHLLVRHATLRAAAFDDHGVEPDWWPAPWSALAAALMLDPDADLHALLASAIATTTPGIRDALVRWGATPLGGSFTAAGPNAEASEDHASDLPRLVAAVKGSRLKIDLHRLARELAEAERTRDMVRARALFSERQRLTQELKSLGG